MKRNFHKLRELIQVGLNTSSNEIKDRFVQVCFQSLAYLKCTCEDMLDLMKLPEKTFAKQYLFGCFSSNNSDLVCFAVGYKSTKSSRHGKTSHMIFQLFHSAVNVLARCVFH